MQTFPSIGLPCAPDGLITITANEIFHMNFNKNGAWGTSTSAGNFTLQNGTFTFDAHGNVTSFTPNGIVYTGHFAVWFGFSANKQNFVLHDIFNVMGNATAADGSTLTFTAHLVDHLSVSAAPSGGNLNMFFLVGC